jgi:hypothetical protein
VFFTLAISAGSALKCAALAERARSADPRVMPVPGPATIEWKSPDERVAVLRWGAEGRDPGSAYPASASPAATAGFAGSDGGSQWVPRSRAGTIWVDPSDGLGAPLRARTSLTRVDPVYAAEVADAVILSDRAMWLAAVAGRLADHDPLHACALLGGPGFPMGAVTPFTGIRALDGGISAEVRAGMLVLGPGAGVAANGHGGDPLAGMGNTAGLGDIPGPGDIPGLGRAGTVNSLPGSADVAAALVAAVSPLRALTEPVELSLTGGKDSRLIVAALLAAGVPVRAKTHGFAAHPDVTVAAEIARRLGIEHVVREPASPEARIDVVTRIRATVLVADGMLSAFENVGRPDHFPSPMVTAGGHGGELLRGGYAETAGAGRPDAGTLATVKRAARGTELLRRLTTRHVALLRPGPAARYLASLAPWTTATLAHGPLRALDDFYLVNRAGRWSAAARQAYLLRENLVQPLFDDGVVRAARQVPLADRVRGALPAAVLRELQAGLADIPYAGKPAKGAVPATFDWRRQYGDRVARFLRDYTMDLGSTSSLFDVVSPAAAEKALALPHSDRATVWALATMACLNSGDYRNARAEAPFLSVELTPSPTPSTPGATSRPTHHAMPLVAVISVGARHEIRFLLLSVRSLDHVRLPLFLYGYYTHSRPRWRPATRAAPGRQPQPGRPGASAAAVDVLGPPEEDQADNEEPHAPDDGGDPQLRVGHDGVATGLQRDVIAGTPPEQCAGGGVEWRVAGRVLPVGRHQGNPDQRDEHRRRVEGEDLPHPAGQVLDGQRRDHVHDAAEVPGDPQEERDQLADVGQAAAHPGDHQRRADVEQRLQDNYRDQQEPVLRRVLVAADHDDEQHHQADAHLLQLDDHVGQRQRGTGEVQRADELQVDPHHRGGGDDRPLGEGEDEHARDQERRVVRHSLGLLEQEAEDQVVDARVQQRREHLPELAQLRVGVHRHVARGGVAHDEVAPSPQRRDVLP